MTNPLLMVLPVEKSLPMSVKIVSRLLRRSTTISLSSPSNMHAHDFLHFARPFTSAADRGQILSIGVKYPYVCPSCVIDIDIAARISPDELWVVEEVFCWRVFVVPEDKLLTDIKGGLLRLPGGQWAGDQAQHSDPETYRTGSMG